MSATRFYFPSGILMNSPVSPAYDAGWEQTGGAFTRKILIYKPKLSFTTIVAGFNVTIPITTTQDILTNQFISEPIPAQRITGTFSLVIPCDENATTNNATLAVVVKVVSQDGGTVRGTLFSVFGTDTEFPLAASVATRIVNTQAVTALTTQPGDRIVVEVGAHAAAPTAAGNFDLKFGYNKASDFALTSALTTDLNPWCEFSQDLFGTQLNNYQFIKAGDGISVGEKIR